MDIFYDICYFVITFLIVVLIYMLFVNRKRKGIKSEGTFTEPSYLIKRFKLDTKKISYKKIMWITTYLNAFIVALTAVIVINIKGIIWEMLAGFVLLLILIFVCYEILGHILVLRGYAKRDKDERSEK